MLWDPNSHMHRGGVLMSRLIISILGGKVEGGIENQRVKDITTRQICYRKILEYMKYLCQLSFVSFKESLAISNFSWFFKVRIYQ